MAPKQRLGKVKERALCKLCFYHLETKDCWALGKVPNCDINNFCARNHPLLHEALVTGRAMLVQEVGGGLNQVCMCREDIKVKVAGKNHCFHALHNCGSTQTLSLIPRPMRQDLCQSGILPGWYGG
jgi:hypothetical protein